VTDRGFRNNNPFNLRPGQPWQGLSPTQTDPDFCQFVAPQWGIRAGCKVLLTYQTDDLNTVRQIINRYAPPSDDNPTNAYVDNVSKACGVDPDAPIDVRAMLPQLASGIIEQENGSNPYSADVINLAIGLAEEP
jgi:hypothetical protein